MSDGAYRPHDVEWTADKIRRFWAWWSENVQADYFAKAVGGEIVDFARKHGALGHGRVLDYGCGPGFLLDELIVRGISCEGFDLSLEAVESVRRRLGSNPLFRGAFCAGEGEPPPAGAFSTVFFIETIEHLGPEDCASTLAEIKRLLRPGGHLVVTTPNDEDLRDKTVICPDCGAVFHRIQHVRSFDRDSLSRLLVEHGFEVSLATTRTLRSPSVLNPVRDAVRRFRGGRALNLLAVGRRP